jgi:hypothetical protein
MVKHAAARRATRRLPLGEPPLVITTHAITSFRSSLPAPTGDQPRARAGSSPSCHGNTTRKPADYVSASTDIVNLSCRACRINRQTGKGGRRSGRASRGRGSVCHAFRAPRAHHHPRRFGHARDDAGSLRASVRIGCMRARVARRDTSRDLTEVDFTWSSAYRPAARSLRGRPAEFPAQSVVGRTFVAATA